MNLTDIAELGLTSDTDLRNIAKDLNIKLNWIGFEEDLTNQPKEDGGYIINIGDNTGTHWCGLAVKGDEAFYFDSFMVPPNDPVVKWVMDNKFDKFNYNNKEQFQQLNEELCGLWVIVFLYYSQKNEAITLAKRFNRMVLDI